VRLRLPERDSAHPAPTGRRGAAPARPAVHWQSDSTVRSTVLSLSVRAQRHGHGEARRGGSLRLLDLPGVRLLSVQVRRLQAHVYESVSGNVTLKSRE
jgi:hypothetical protein